MDRQVKIIEIGENNIPVANMKPGEFAIVVKWNDKVQHSLEIVYCWDDGLVWLNKPCAGGPKNWYKGLGEDCRVRLLPAGTTIEL